MRRPLIVCNWKMAMTLEETRAFVRTFAAQDLGQAAQLDLVICPPATALTTLQAAAEGTPLQLGAQDLSPHADPAHTGQLSAALLRDAGAEWVLVGHFETRAGERAGDPDLLQAKIRRALEGGLRPILLLGEDEPTPDAAARIETRIRRLLSGCTPEEIQRMGFIYEPSWAIGQDEPAPAEQVDRGAQALRAALALHFGTDVAAEVPIIYGGSVTPENAERLLSIRTLDGLGMGRRGRDPGAVARLVEQVLRARSAAAAPENAGLWYWFLFESGLSTQRAKELLTQWQDEGERLEELLTLPPQAKAQHGLAPREIAQLEPPETLPEVTAVQWDAPLYPAGLRQLPLRLRPALLFTAGPAPLLARPLLYLPPLPLTEQEGELLQEAIGLLLGEGLLPATLAGSPQATVLLQELTHAEGEGLLFVRSGLERHPISPEAKALIENGRLLLVSPLPPTTPEHPDLAPVLAQVEGAAAKRCLLIGTFLETPCPPAKSLHLVPPGTPPRPDLRQVEDPAEVLLWLSDLEPPSTGTLPEPQPGVEAAPLSPEETLNILEQGGAVPRVLRERLRKQQG